MNADDKWIEDNLKKNIEDTRGAGTGLEPDGGEEGAGLARLDVPLDADVAVTLVLSSPIFEPSEIINLCNFVGNLEH